MDRERKDGLFFEMDFRWAGEPEIHLAVQLAGSCAAALGPVTLRLPAALRSC